MSSKTDRLCDGKRRIWDEYDDNGGKKVSVINHDNSTACVSITPAAAATTTCSDSNPSENITNKIVSMNEELKAKSNALQQAKSHLGRLKKSNEQKLLAIRQSHDDIMASAQRDHENAVSEQKSLLAQLKQDCKDMKSREQELSNEISHIASSREDLLKTLEVSGRRELHKARKTWEHLERSRFESLLSGESMKQDAAKALEPKVAAILKRNKKEQKDCNETQKKETEMLRIKLTHEYQQKYSTVSASIRSEMVQKLNQKESALQNKFHELSNDYAEEIERTNREWNDQNRVDSNQFDANVRLSDEAHMKALASIREQEEREIVRALEGQRKALESIKSRHNEDLGSKGFARGHALEEEKRQKKLALRAESEALIQEAIGVLEKKRRDELTDIERKLYLESNEKTISFERDVEDDLAKLEKSLELEKTASRRRNEKIIDESKRALKEKETVGQLLQKRKEQVSRAKQDLLSNAKDSLEGTQSQSVKLKQSSCEGKHTLALTQTAIDKARAKAEAIEASTKAQVVKEAIDREAERQKITTELKQHHEDEIRSIQCRLCSLKQSRKDCIKRTEQELLQKKAEREHLEKLLSENRILA